MRRGSHRWNLAPLAGVLLALCVSPGRGTGLEEKTDRFMQLARNIQKDFEVVPVIENGRHALEATFTTQTSPKSILEGYRKLFESQKLKCQAHLPTGENSPALFRGYIGDEEKRLVMLPSPDGSGFLVRVLSYQDEETFRQRHPSVLERHQEFKDLDGKVAFQKETFSGTSHSATLVYFSTRAPRDAFAAVRSRLEQSGWKSVLPDPSNTAPKDSSKARSCVMRKGTSTAVIAVTSRDQETNVVATVTTRRDP